MKKSKEECKNSWWYDPPNADSWFQIRNYKKEVALLEDRHDGRPLAKRFQELLLRYQKIATEIEEAYEERKKREDKFDTDLFDTRFFFVRGLRQNRILTEISRNALHPSDNFADFRTKCSKAIHYVKEKLEVLDKLVTEKTKVPEPPENIIPRKICWKAGRQNLVALFKILREIDFIDIDSWTYLPSLLRDCFIYPNNTLSYQGIKEVKKEWDSLPDIREDFNKEQIMMDLAEKINSYLNTQ